MRSLREQRPSRLVGRRPLIYPPKIGGIGAAARRRNNNLHKKKQSCICNYITSDVHRAAARSHPQGYGLSKAANKGDRTTSGRIIPTIDFCCWVLQTETVGLSGQDPSALSLTKRVFSGLIRQKAYYRWSPTPRQLDKEKRLPANMSLLHRLGGMSHNISQRPKLSLSVHSKQPSGVFHTIYFCIFVFWYGLAPSFAVRPLSFPTFPICGSLGH